LSYNSLTGEVWKGINAQLGHYFDKKDPIRTAFRIGGLRRNGGRRGGKQTPRWANDAKAFQKILLRSFPKMEEGRNLRCCSSEIGEHMNGIRCRCPYHQRKAAGRWALIARMFWGMGMTQTGIWVTLNAAPGGDEDSVAPMLRRDSRQIEDFTSYGLKQMRMIKDTLRNIRRAANGLRADGSGKATRRRPGRPSKSVHN
jgi:hypothetical protein